MYYFIVNPNSQCGKGYHIWKKIEKQLNHGGVEYKSMLTREPGDAKTYAKELTEGCKEPRIIVIVGGDGTMNEVLDGLVFGIPITIGYIPAGSGNDLARSLKLPRRPSRCLKKILNPKYHRLLDYGVLSYGDDTISYRRFAVSGGIGLDAAVCHNLLYSKMKMLLNKIHLGKLSYFLIGCKQLLQAHSSKGYILLDGVKKVEFNHVYFISLHIHPFEGGGFRFAPKADCSDGKLTVCVVSNSEKVKLIQILLHALMRKKYANKGIRTYECQEVQVHMERPMPVHVDGESCFCQQDIQCRCIEKKLRIIV